MVEGGFKAHTWAVVDGADRCCRSSPFPSPESLNLGLLGTEGAYRLLSLRGHASSEAVVFLARGSRGINKMGRANTSCSLVLRLCGCFLARDRQNHAPNNAGLPAVREEGEHTPQKGPVRGSWWGLRKGLGWRWVLLGRIPGGWILALDWPLAGSRGNAVTGYLDHFNLEGKRNELKRKLCLAKRQLSFI